MKTPAAGWLRLEGLAVLVVACVAYGHFHLPWLWFAVFLLAPDLGLLGYLGSARTGAWVYNLAHFYALALALVAWGLTADARVPLGLGLIWCAHIGMDRAVGYGLKLPEGFGFTHLGRVGHKPPPAAS